MLLDAVAALRRGDVLLVAKRGRLGRDVIAVAMSERLIAKRGARVVSPVAPLLIRGTMKCTDAEISQMTTGFKRVVLKPVDLIFKKEGGGAAIPIKITGTRSEPSFGLDKGRVLKRH